MQSGADREEEEVSGFFFFCFFLLFFFPSSAKPRLQSRWFQPSARTDVTVGSAFNDI